MFHGISKVFNKEQLEEYLNASWNLIHVSKSDFDKDRSVFHICSAHLLHRISYKLERNIKPTKHMKRMILYVMARLISCTSFNDFEQLFTALCMLCLAKKTYPEINPYVSKIENTEKKK